MSHYIHGMRRGEILALQKKDIDFVNFKIYISKNKVQTSKGIFLKCAKNGRSRSIDIDYALALYLLELTQNMELEQELFAGIQPNYVTTFFGKTIRKSNITVIRFYDLRHIHASILLTSNACKANIILIISQRLGHSSIKITLETYAHLLQDSQADAITCLEQYI